MNFSELTSLQKNALIMVLINALSIPLMLSSVNVALPSISRDLNMSAVLLSWVPMAFLMASAMFVLVFGFLADIFGRKKVFLIGTIAAALTSLLAGMASSAESLVFLRFLQGVSSAMLYATQIAIVSSVFPPPKRGTAIGLVVSVLYLGLALGPILGGFLIEQFSWRACFLLQPPLAMIVVYLGIYKVPEDWASDTNLALHDLDLKGTVLYAIVILALSIAVSTLPSTYSFVILLGGLLSFWIFIKVESVVKHPIFNISLFKNNRIFSLSCLSSFLMYTATFANVVLASLYLQYLKDYPASSTGMIMMTQALVMAICSPLAGRLSDHIEPRIISSFGIGLTVIGLILLSSMDSDSSNLAIIGALIFTGAGFGLFSSPNTNAIMSAVDKSQYGIASSINSTMRVVGQLSSMIMVTLFMSLLMGTNKIKAENYDQLQNVIHLSFLVSALICLPAIYFSLRRGRMH